MHPQAVAWRQALRPSSVLLSGLPVVAIAVAVHADLATRPIVRLDVETGGVAAAGGPDRVLSTYRVRPGDTLESVAALHDVPVRALAERNHRGRHARLSPGDALRVPDVARPPAGLDVGPKTGIADLLTVSARAAHVPADLLQAVAWRESSWRQGVVSDRGAVGVGQVLPSTAAWVSARLGGPRLDPADVADNARVAAIYLRLLLDRYDGDVAAALVAYHQGPEALDRDGWYASSTAYVADVFRLRHEFTG